MATPDDEGFDADTSALVAHAGAVDAIADEIELARSAATQVELGRDAYGQFCQVIPQLINPLQEGCIDVLTAARDRLSDTADALRQTARGYAEADRSAVSRFYRQPS